MRHFEVLTLSDKQIEDTFHLWNREYPKLLGHKDKLSFKVFLSQLDDVEHQLVEDENNDVVAWLFQFRREKENWFGLIIDRDYQKSGIGSELIRSAKLKNNKLNGWVVEESIYEKEDGTIYNSPLEFYLKNEYKPIGHDIFESNNIKVIKIRWSKA